MPPLARELLVRLKRQAPEVARATAAHETGLQRLRAVEVELLAAALAHLAPALPAVASLRRWVGCADTVGVELRGLVLQHKPVTGCGVGCALVVDVDGALCAVEEDEAHHVVVDRVAPADVLPEFSVYTCLESIVAALDTQARSRANHTAWTDRRAERARRALAELRGPGGRR